VKSSGKVGILGMSKIFVQVIFLICILNGCQMIKEKTSGPEFEDTKMTAIIKAQLARDDQATLQAVTVDVDDGVVKLKGKVNSEQKKAKAEEIARKVDGVKNVVNNLEVKP
jgi:hyperosmotically inducible periplasmic protein